MAQINVAQFHRAYTGRHFYLALRDEHNSAAAIDAAYSKASSLLYELSRVELTQEQLIKVIPLLIANVDALTGKVLQFYADTVEYGYGLETEQTFYGLDMS